MKQIIDSAKWHEAWLDTPMGIPQGRVDRAHKRKDPDDLLDVPGVNLKSRERPMMFAKLVEHSDAKVVVRSKPDCLNSNMECVWVGTPSEYARMWTVD